jgi:hypothetical protein
MSPNNNAVVPAKARIHFALNVKMGRGFRRDDDRKVGIIVSIPIKTA